MQMKSANIQPPSLTQRLRDAEAQSFYLSTDLRRLPQIAVWLCRSAEAAQISIFSAEAKLVLPPPKKQEISGPLGPLHSHAMNAGKAKVAAQISLRPCVFAPLR